VMELYHQAISWFREYPAICGYLMGLSMGFSLAIGLVAYTIRGR
jgi:hypothetical protein